MHLSKKTKFLITTILLLMLTIFFIVTLKLVDVKPIGPQETRVGYATLNKAVFDKVGTSSLWLDVTKYMGYGCLAVAGLFTVLAVIQLIRRWSLSAVDRHFKGVIVLYLAVLVVEALFRYLVINRRPVLLPGETVPAPSFPSTHTMIACVAMGSAVMMIDYYVENSLAQALLQFFCILCMIILVGGRLLAGVHWLTDIIGGILISLVLLTTYRGYVDIEKK